MWCKVIARLLVARMVLSVVNYLWPSYLLGCGGGHKFSIRLTLNPVMITLVIFFRIAMLLYTL